MSDIETITVSAWNHLGYFEKENKRIKTYDLRVDQRQVRIGLLHLTLISIIPRAYPSIIEPEHLVCERERIVEVLAQRTGFEQRPFEVIKSGTRVLLGKVLGKGDV